MLSTRIATNSISPVMPFAPRQSFPAPKAGASRRRYHRNVREGMQSCLLAGLRDLNVRIEKASTHHPPAYLNPTVHRLNGNEHVQHAALTAHIPQKTSKSDVCHAPHSAVTRHPIACDQQRTPRTNQPIASAAVRGKEPLYQEYGIRDHPATEIAIRERIRRTRATVYYLAQTRGKRRT